MGERPWLTHVVEGWSVTPGVQPSNFNQYRRHKCGVFSRLG